MKPARARPLLLLSLALLLTGCRSAPAAPTPAVTTPFSATPTPPPTLVSPSATPPPAAATGPPPVAPSPAAALPAPSLFDRPWDDREPFRAGLIAAEQAALDGLAGATVYHLDLTIDDSLALLYGRQEIRYTNLEGLPLGELYFHLFPNLLGGYLSLANVQVNGRPIARPLNYELSESAVRLPLPGPLAPGEQVVVSLDFTVEVPPTPGSNYGAFALLDGVLSLAHFYPLVAVYDDQGWNVALPPPHADVVYADASFYLARITAPADQTLVASGRQVARDTSAARQVVTFAAGPARDFYLVSSDRFVAASATAGETTIHSYALEHYSSGGELALDYAVAALDQLGDRLGHYPFTEFDVVSTNNLALGIEYPGIVVITLRLYDPAATVSGLPSQTLLESVVAHEAAHQWFYSAVGNDQLDDPWLDESLAQYATYLYYLDRHGRASAEGFRRSFLDRWDRVGREDIPVGLPAAAYDGLEYGAIVYGRGALFFEALHETLGDDAFRAFLRDYYQVHKWAIATPESLRRLAEVHCGCNLEPLFSAWVYPS